MGDGPAVPTCGPWGAVTLVMLVSIFGNCLGALRPVFSPNVMVGRRVPGNRDGTRGTNLAVTNAALWGTRLLRIGGVVVSVA